MGVNDVSFPASARDEASSDLAKIAAEFAEELDGPLALAELLEILGGAVPSGSEAIDGVFPHPFSSRWS
jgi:hypothetical protein